MSRNSTLKLWNDILKKENIPFSDELIIDKFNSLNNIGPKETTINTILAYSRSVKGLRNKSGDNILVSLN